MPRREDHEVHKRICSGIGEKKNIDKTHLKIPIHASLVRYFPIKVIRSIYVTLIFPTPHKLELKIHI